jgi:hypothetical protein
MKRHGLIEWRASFSIADIMMSDVLRLVDRFDGLSKLLLILTDGTDVHRVDVEFEAVGFDGVTISGRCRRARSRDAIVVN